VTFDGEVNCPNKKERYTSHFSNSVEKRLVLTPNQSHLTSLKIRRMPAFFTTWEENRFLKIENRNLIVSVTFLSLK
jgi:hypothetical protein